MSLVYRFLRAIVRLFFTVCSDYVVVGRENLPQRGPLIVAVNHIHTLDSPAVMAALPWQVATLAARKWERRFKGFLLRLTGAIFVSRGKVDRQALHRALTVLRLGGVLGIAPEGTRSRTFDLQPARGGIAYLAYLSGAPILPVAVTGVENVIPALLRLRRASVRVAIGRPFVLHDFRSRPKTSELLEQADTVMRQIAALLPPEYQGVYREGRRMPEHRPVPRD
ncbi:MAG: lysophospholipid acyltransferase family protein [Anaerolineae bacterium]|nr:lysophospholipid acyltransferase family protein [Anaerolineae bacterium]